MPRASAIFRFSLPDWIFIPLALVVIGAMIALAIIMRPTGLTPTITETRFTVTGPALGDMIAGPGTSIRLDPGAAEGPVARLRANASFQAAGRMSAGVAVIPTPEWEDRIAGRNLRVEMDVRAASPDGPYDVRIGYFTIGFGDSDWREVAIGTEYRTVGFEWRAPADAVANDDEAVGIWPDPEGLGREVVVRAIRVIILPDETDD